MGRRPPSPPQPAPLLSFLSPCGGRKKTGACSFSADGDEDEAVEDDDGDESKEDEPSPFDVSIEHSLKPTIRYLVEEVGIRSDISKVVWLSLQILVQRIENSGTSRFSLLSRELGAPKDSIVKLATKHPQLLHYYSIDDGVLLRINSPGASACATLIS